MGEAMDEEVPQGTERWIDGRLRVYYDGYWVKAYDVPRDTLLAKKRLIEALTHRLFNHVEPGLNVPGTRLEEARRAYENESDPKRRRVKAAMLAGALFNRATDVFTKLVELQALGVVIQPDNALMRECGRHLQEALSLGKMVLHRSGEEGIDELWGEPFKAFAYPIEEFYKSRYLKIAMTMRAIDRIAAEMKVTLASHPAFAGVGPLLDRFAEAAKLKTETLRTDVDVFEVWTSFVVSAEELQAFRPSLPESPPPGLGHWLDEGVDLIRRGSELVTWMARARVPMPKSTREFLERCHAHAARVHLAEQPGHERELLRAEQAPRGVPPSATA
jgi:hypothetical protein